MYANLLISATHASFRPVLACHHALLINFGAMRVLFINVA